MKKKNKRAKQKRKLRTLSCKRCFGSGVVPDMEREKIILSDGTEAQPVKPCSCKEEGENYV